MTLITCPECGRHISNRANYCPGCGIPQREISRIITRGEIQSKATDPTVIVPVKDTAARQNSSKQKNVHIPIRIDSKRVIRCIVCRKVIEDTDEILCPDCKYPFYSLSKDSKQQKKEILDYRKTAGIRIIDKQIGQKYVMGRYHGEEINWQILALKDDKALLLSEKGLDTKPYNENFEKVTWETCSLRKWLNIDFLMEAFSQQEQDRILLSPVAADSNLRYKTEPGKGTEDRLFLLSIKEVREYFANGDDRKAETTNRAKQKGAYEDSAGKCWWWLRTPGLENSMAAFVRNRGQISGSGNLVNYELICVRPAMWVRL